MPLTQEQINAIKQYVANQWFYDSIVKSNLHDILAFIALKSLLMFAFTTILILILIKTIVTMAKKKSRNDEGTLFMVFVLSVVTAFLIYNNISENLDWFEIMSTPTAYVIMNFT